MTLSLNGNALMVANWDSDVGYAWWLMESYWIEISNLLQADTTFLAYPTISRIPDAIEKSSLKTVELDMVENRLSNLIEQLTFIRENRIRFIYLTDQSYTDLKYALYRMAGVKKIIIHDHTPGLRPPAKGFKKSVKTLIRKLPLVNPDAYFGATEFVRNRLIENACIADEKAYAITNGISEAQQPAKSLREITGVSAKTTLIVTVARANRYKGVDFALKVLGQLENENCSDWHYAFIGDGPDLDLFKGQAKSLNIEDNVTFTGRLDNAEQYLKDCDIAFHPSKGEVGYSLSILEYMKSCLPVVVPDNPSVCGATADRSTGLIYKENDTESAAYALKELIVNVEMRESFSSEAFINFKEYFSLSRTHQLLRSAVEKTLTET